MRNNFQRLAYGTVSREKHFELINMVPDATKEDYYSGKAYIGRWHEINETEYQYMLEILFPLFLESNKFGLSEFKAGTVTSIYFKLNILGNTKYYHCFCDVSNKENIANTENYIKQYEEERWRKLNQIWKNTAPEYRGISSKIGAWSENDLGKQTLLIYVKNQGTTLCLLECLTDEMISLKLKADS